MCNNRPLDACADLAVTNIRMCKGTTMLAESYMRFISVYSLSQKKKNKTIYISYQ